ncbi:MAG: hypothetical protein EXQ99_06905 [Alphaproteobacteria bacterium]|nr:hypothetical protein [Alphaproteobacteria bacterium]
MLKPLLPYACPAYGTVLDPFAGSGSVGIAAKIVRRQRLWDRWGCKLVAGWPHLVG